MFTYNQEINFLPKCHSKWTSNFPLIDNLKMPARASKRDVLVLATLRYLGSFVFQFFHQWILVYDGLLTFHWPFFRLETITAQCEGMLSRNEKRVHIILTITVDMYLYLVSTPAQPWQVHDTTLATIITSLLTILFTNGSQTNVDIAAQKLKVNLSKENT